MALWNIGKRETYDCFNYYSQILISYGIHFNGVSAACQLIMIIAQLLKNILFDNMKWIHEINYRRGDGKLKFQKSSGDSTGGHRDRCREQAPEYSGLIIPSKVA